MLGEGRLDIVDSGLGTGGVLCIIRSFNPKTGRWGGAKAIPPGTPLEDVLASIPQSQSPSRGNGSLRPHRRALEDS